MKIDHPYEFVQGTTPLLISMPHPGLLLPAEVADLLTPEARALPDTDWHIPQLYGFASQMGASLLMARYSRFASTGRKMIRRSIRPRPPASSRTRGSTARRFSFPAPRAARRSRRPARNRSGAPITAS
jgi:N-formylglutamate amidohydrolase